jgi:hypothetical protein
MVETNSEKKKIGEKSGIGRELMGNQGKHHASAPPPLSTDEKGEYGSLIGPQTRHLIPNWHYESISSRPCAPSAFAG